MPEPPPPLTPQALAWLRQSVLVDGSTYSRVLLHLLERVEALDARPIPGPCVLAADCSALDARAWSYIGKQAMCGDPAATALVGLLNEPPGLPAPTAAPARGLVERVEGAIRPNIPGDLNVCRHEARAAIREVAAWFDQRGQHGCSLLLREEADR
jgi:hypothetical protein